MKASHALASPKRRPFCEKLCYYIFEPRRLGEAEYADICRSHAKRAVCIARPRLLRGPEVHDGHGPVVPGPRAELISKEFLGALFRGLLIISLYVLLI